MARSRLEDRMVRKIQKDSKGSVRITLPIELVRTLKWRDGQKVELKKYGNGMLIEDWKR